VPQPAVEKGSVFPHSAEKRAVSWGSRVEFARQEIGCALTAHFRNCESRVLCSEVTHSSSGSNGRGSLGRLKIGVPRSLTLLSLFPLKNSVAFPKQSLCYRVTSTSAVPIVSRCQIHRSLSVVARRIGPSTTPAVPNKITPPNRKKNTTSEW
jgi:hypothetical protein